MSKQIVKVRCTVQVEVECGTWSDDTTMAQITEQGKTEAEGRIRRLLTDAVTSDEDMKLKRSSLHGIRVRGIGDFMVFAVGASPVI